MTALVTPERPRSKAPTATYAFPSAPRTIAHPPLRVIEGGRSPAGRAASRSSAARTVLAVVVVALVAVLLWGIVTLGAPPAAKALGTAPHITSTRYVVRPGDSLWAIATALHRDGDVRDVVDRLAQVNGSTSVFAGEKLRIPADLLH